MANAFYLPVGRMKAIRRTVCRPGRVVLWLFAPGALGNETPAQGIRAATGIRVRQIHGGIRPIIRFSGASTLIDGLRNSVFRYTPAPVWMEKDADLAAPTRLSPAFFIDDPKAEPIAYWEGTKKAAIAARQEPWGVSIFCALPLVPRHFLQNLLRASLGHIYSIGPDVWMANRGVLAVHTRRGGPRTICLPEKADVFDGNTGQQKAFGALSFKTHLPPRSTTIWLVKPTTKKR
jgi:hypothetical protein